LDGIPEQFRNRRPNAPEPANPPPAEEEPPPGGAGAKKPSSSDIMFVALMALLMADGESYLFRG
jgi:hypothetical protein